MSRQPTYSAFDQLLLRWSRFRDDVSIGVVRRGARTEANRGAIDFWLTVQKGEQSGRAIDEKNQQPGRERVQGARMTDASHRQHAPNAIDYIV